MSTVLLDTNIVSYLFKEDSRAQAYASDLLGNELAIAIMTVAELLQWAAVRNWGLAQTQRLEVAMNAYTLLPIDVETCRWWATVRVQRRAVGQPLAPQDAWIAATALRYNLPLITHNPSDYQQIAGLTLITQA